MRRKSTWLLALCAVVLSACSERDSDRPTVVVYTSADEHLASEVIAAFEAQSNVQVQRLGDTEQTKTTGLVQRLLAEKDHPRADVWWSSEALGTVKLARAGVLAPFEAKVASELEGGWPQGLRDEDGRWYGLAQRARVIAYNTQRVPTAEAPRTLEELTHERWRGRVGMARPQFGTTRGHMAAIVARHGPEALETWLIAMKANGLKIYDGNSTAVRAVSRGEIDVCLTDTDDVWSAQRNGWPVKLKYERADSEPSEGLQSVGPLVIPNTVALVAEGPNPSAGAAFIEFLLSEQAERIIAQSDSHNVPVHPSLAGEFAQYAIPSPWRPSPDVIADHAEQAIEICTRVLGR